MKLNTVFRTGDVSVEATALRFKAARIAFRISSSQMAELAQHGGTTITNIEKARQRPSPKTVHALYSRTGVDFNFIYLGEYRGLPAQTIDLIAAACTLISTDLDG